MNSLEPCWQCKGLIHPLGEHLYPMEERMSRYRDLLKERVPVEEELLPVEDQLVNARARITELEDLCRRQRKALHEKDQQITGLLATVRAKEGDSRCGMSG